MVCRSLGANPDDLKDPIKISIPRYVLCGQGKDEHYEFEIKITVLDETWTVFRRYSRFREMHKTLKLKYPERVVVNGSASDGAVTSDDPQGSMLGPVLLNIFISDTAGSSTPSASLQMASLKDGMPERDLDGLKKCACVNLRRFQKTKCRSCT
ncbi:hypothetical protein WISP_127912 [Willisornis vidua]|uniref:PX domain-containing protein n=1 Tax=Willisornis vidua TaxID=1566151 RepID=A0ABQ9CVR9_9PASS|nr:hypothetical protein WISP_127912 [Willisornis vidua]